MRRTGVLAIAPLMVVCSRVESTRAEGAASVAPAPPSKATSPGFMVDAHVGGLKLDDLPMVAATVGGGLRWAVAPSWRLMADVDLGYSYGKGILGSHRYENGFAVVRAGPELSLDDRRLFRLDASLGVGPARLYVTGEQSNPSEVTLSYVASVGFGAGWFHLEVDYFGHSAEPCEATPSGQRCYPLSIGAGLLLGVQVPLGS